MDRLGLVRHFVPVCLLITEFRFRFLVQLLGIVVGHLYFFLVFKYPTDFNGPQLLQTPSFLYIFLLSENFSPSNDRSALRLDIVFSPICQRRWADSVQHRQLELDQPVMKMRETVVAPSSEAVVMFWAIIEWVKAIMNDRFLCLIVYQEKTDRLSSRILLTNKMEFEERER